MSSQDLCFIPYLNYSDWDIKTAYNLALFASLAYANQEESLSLNLESVKKMDFAHIDGVLNIFEKLAKHQRTKTFHKVKAHLFVEEAEQAQAFDHENLCLFEQLGVKLYVVSKPDTVLIFIQGTENILNFFADFAKILIPKDKKNSLSKFIIESLNNNDNFLDSITKNFKLRYETTSFIEHKKAIVNYLFADRNAEAHLGFMAIIASFLFDPKFLNAMATHNIKHKKIFICGHSLGGALSLLLARELQASCTKAICVYTYGCPRLGSKKFLESIDGKIIHYRVINGFDPIAWMYNDPNYPDLWCDHGIIKHLYEEDGKTKLKHEAVHEKDWPMDHFIKSYIDKLTALSKPHIIKAIRRPHNPKILTPRLKALPKLKKLI